MSVSAWFSTSLLLFGSVRAVLLRRGECQRLFKVDGRDGDTRLTDYNSQTQTSETCKPRLTVTAFHFFHSWWWTEKGFVPSISSSDQHLLIQVRVEFNQKFPHLPVRRSYLPGIANTSPERTARGMQVKRLKHLNQLFQCREQQLHAGSVYYLLIPSGTGHRSWS